MSSARQDALAVIRSRVGGISVSAGYQTDAGQLVFLAEAPTLGPDDPTAALAIVIGDDSPGYQGLKLAITLPVEIQALAQVEDVTDPWSTVEAVIADVKTAVETDHDLAGTLLPRGLERGSTRTLKREEGSTYVGASIEYRLVYAEAWGAP